MTRLKRLVFILAFLFTHAAVADAGRDFIIAARDGDLDTVKRMMAEGADVNVRQGYTPLMAAARFGHVDVIQFLLTKGADVNARGQFYDDTALLYAAWNRNLALVKILLAHGAEADVPGLEAMTPLFAAVKGYPETTNTPRETVREIVRLLLAKGADPHVRNNYNQVSAVAYARMSGDQELVKILIDARASWQGVVE
jgi:ankyrin repeat protein